MSMVIFDRRHMPALMLVLSAVMLIVTVPITHIGLKYLPVAVLGLLLVAAFSLLRAKSNSELPEKKVSGVFLKGGLIFLFGAGYGLMNSINRGWEWIDLVPFTISTSIGAYLLWLGFRPRRSSVQ